MQAQITAIPDKRFEQVLISIGIDSDGLVNGQILNSDAEAVTQLRISNKYITSLVGISAFTNLIDLDCRDNQLSSLDLSGNKSVSYTHLTLPTIA